jgi:uncharacterized protein (TIGR03067 family)
MMTRVAFFAFLLLAGLSFSQEVSKPSAGDLAKQELAKFQGEWKIKNLSGKTVVHLFKGNEYTTSINGVESNAKVTFVIDAATDPKRITRTATNNGDVSHGIYKFDGNDLVICTARVGQERPTEFKNKDGEWTLITWTRVTN